MSQNALNSGLSVLPLSGDERITYEDVLRGHDRLKVLKMRAAKSCAHQTNWNRSISWDSAVFLVIAVTSQKVDLRQTSPRQSATRRHDVADEE